MLRMASSFSNGGETWSEIREHSNGDSLVAQHLSFQAGELPGSELSADPARTGGTSIMTTQMAWEQDEIMADVIMEDADSGAEEYWALLQDLVTETTASSPYLLGLADYTNEDGYGIDATPNPSINLLNTFPSENSPLYMLGTSDGVLNNSYVMDDLTTMSRRYGVFPFIKKTAVCFHNHQLSQLLGQHLTGPLPQLQMTLAPPKSITLVLDMDETLIHSSMKNEGADFSFTMLNEGKEYTVYVKKRPFVDDFLEKVAEMFHIAVFTASVRPYADQLLDILDPGNRLISRRYYRDSCHRVGNNYLKDLTIIEPDLAKVAIIDNTPEVYQIQVNNGIPIKTWLSDPFDAALPELMPFLQTLSVTEDVRPIIATKFINQR